MGAGKTTCMIAMAKWLTYRGLRCGLITNDQADGLVDTALALAGVEGGAGQAVRQVTGGCFCCHANELGKALLELDEEVRPNIFIAEPVGSCTDLVATVLLPLKEIYHGNLAAAPMSVVVDSRRLHDMVLKKLSKTSKLNFSRDVRYIYLKQLEEADIIILNKKDLLNGGEMTRLINKLSMDWPRKKIIQVSARSGEGMDDWFSLVLDSESSTPESLLNIDYQRYGKGEALLGWFNARLRLNNGPWEIDGDEFLEGLANNIKKRLQENGIEIAHFKMSLRSDENDKVGTSGLAVVNVVRNDSPAEISLRMKARVKAGEILINLRAEGAPQMLKRIVLNEIKELPLSLENVTAFKPAKPVPIYRVTA